MKDLKICLKNRPGALATLGEALEKAGVSIEGGGVFGGGDEAVAHFLFEDGAQARQALEHAGLTVLEERGVLVQRLNQARPGQLGRIARRMSDAGVNIDVMYSDHDHQLILAVDNEEKGRAVCEAWSMSVEAPAARREHRYTVDLRWTGNTGSGTSGYRDYKRDHELSSPEKPTLPGSSDPVFRGDRTRWNPEELLVGSLSACHQLWYLHLCSDAGITVTEYSDRPEGVMCEDATGGGAFTRVLLRPKVTVTESSDRMLALSLHQQAHAKCFIARSVHFPVEIAPEISGGRGSTAD
ncbi:MAG: OsmC family protein [Myxococcaceae bacterium]